MMVATAPDRLSLALPVQGGSSLNLFDTCPAGSITGTTGLNRVICIKISRSQSSYRSPLMPPERGEME